MRMRVFQWTTCGGWRWSSLGEGAGRGARDRAEVLVGTNWPNRFRGWAFSKAEGLARRDLAGAVPALGAALPSREGRVLGERSRARSESCSRRRRFCRTSSWLNDRSRESSAVVGILGEEAGEEDRPRPRAVPERGEDRFGFVELFFLEGAIAFHRLGPALTGLLKDVAGQDDGQPVLAFLVEVGGGVHRVVDLGESRLEIVRPKQALAVGEGQS